MTLDFVTFITALSSAIIGGLIAGIFSLQSIKKSYEYQVNIEEENEQKLIKSLLQAIHDEIETIYDRYQDTMGAQLDSLQDHEPLLYIYPLANDYFSIYNGNTHIIGRINDNDLRKQIIKTYTLGKSIIDSYRLNNEYLIIYSKWNDMFFETGNEFYKQKADNILDLMIKYALKLKITHKELKTEVNNLLRSLRKQGILFEKK